MSRNGKIKWTKADDKLLVSTVKKFNAKIARVSKRNPALANIQPAKVSTKTLKNELKDYERKEFRRYIGRMERYLRKGAEMPYTTREGVNITLWQKREIANTFNAINARRRAELKKYNPTTTTGRMGAIEQNNLQPRKNTIQSIKPKNWGAFVENLEKQLLGSTESVRQAKYKENFLHAVEVTIGKNSRLYNRLMQVPADRLYQYYYTEPLLQISFTSDPKSAEEIEEIMISRLDALGE